MAKDLSLAQGIGNDAGYLNGNLVDGASGTQIGSHINQDIVQFFQKLMDLASLSPNGKFDNEVNGYQFIDALLKYTNGGLLKKIVDIGDWNMNVSVAGTDQVNVAHGLPDFKKIRKISAIIRNDDDDKYYNLITNDSTVASERALIAATSANIDLAISTGGLMDSVNFDSTSYNRGWIVIEYLP